MRNIELEKEQQDRIRLGQMAEEGFNGDFWNTILKPIIDSMIKGLIDIREIKKSLLSSNKKAEVLVEARATAAEYISEIETLGKGYIIDKDTTLKVLENKKNQKEKSLYKEV